MANLLQRFENSFSEVTWKAMSDAEKLALIFRWFELKIFDAKLNKANAVIEAENYAEIELREREEYIDYLKSLGYACDNGIDDYIKLYNRPEIFGDEWRKKADLAREKCPTLDDFLNLIIQYHE